MKKVVFLSLLLTMLISKAQFTILPSQTTDNHLNYLSVIGSDIFIGGDSGYCARSYNECKTLNILQYKYEHIYSTNWQRLSPNIIIGVEKFSGRLGKTPTSPRKDYNAYWISTGTVFQQSRRYASSYNANMAFVCMFDTTVGYVVGQFGGDYKTIDAGYNWSDANFKFQTQIWPLVSPVLSFGDSIVYSIYQNSLYYTYDKGNNFSIKNLGINILAMANIGKDTVFVCFKDGVGFTKNRSQNWDTSSVRIWKDKSFTPRNLYFKDKNLGFVIGKNANGNAVIGKTETMGQSWWWYDTKMPLTFNHIAAVNDSIAILVGDFGTIARWNYKGSIYSTHIIENNASLSHLYVWPNPTNRNFNINIVRNSLINPSLQLFDLTGRLVKNVTEEELREGVIKTDNLYPGVYNLSLYSNHQLIETEKIVLTKD
jgi:hypothetical protein